MRFFFVLVTFALLFNSTLYGKEKIVDKSGKKPKWVKEENVMLYRVSVKAPTLFEAKAKAKETFSSSFTNAVKYALSIKEDSLKQQRLNQFLVEFQWASIKGAKYDDIRGFSDSLLLDSYWEKARLSNGGYLFKLFYLYDCTEEEIKKIANQFERTDSKIRKLIYPIKARLKQENSIDWLLSVQDTLKRIKGTAHPNFHEQIDAVRKNINAYLSQIELHILEKNSSEIKFQMRKDGKTLPIQKLPSLTSTCAKILNFSNKSNILTIQFDRKYCLEVDPESGFTVEFKARNQSIKRSIPVF